MQGRRKGMAGWDEASRRWFGIQGEGTKGSVSVVEGYGVAEADHGCKLAIQSLLVLKPS